MFNCGCSSPVKNQASPIVQTWETRARNSTLPNDLRTILKLAREYNVKIEATNPSDQAKGEMPLWYHTKSAPSARRLYKSKLAKCLRQKHGVKLVRDATALIARIGTEHAQRRNCLCELCRDLRTNVKCAHPLKCLATTVALLDKIRPEWNPANVVALTDDLINEEEE